MKKLIQLIEIIQINKEIPLLDVLKKVILSFNTKLIFLVEEHNWVIEWDGKCITSNLKKLNLLDAEIASAYITRNKIIHFGSINCLIFNDYYYRVHPSNKIVLTWYHIVPTDDRLKYIPFINKKIDLLHTSSQITKKSLVKYGFDENKIVIIPLGVDISHFKRFTDEKRNSLKKKFNLPEDKIIIGSFQKDGIGWGKGLKPKSIKGPEVFCKVVKKISEEYDIHVFLTGPSRGFVKKQLSKFNIPYTHIFFENYYDIIECYNTIDLYIVSSRVEGGPKALLECMATGIPIVSTKVGMAPTIIRNEFNGCLTEIEDINELFRYSIKIIEDKNFKEEIVKNGLEIIKDYSWEKISKQYYNKLYKQFLKKR